MLCDITGFNVLLGYCITIKEPKTLHDKIFCAVCSCLINVMCRSLSFIIK